MNWLKWCYAIFEEFSTYERMNYPWIVGRGPSSLRPPAALVSLGGSLSLQGIMESRCHWEAVCPYRAWGSIGVTGRQSVLQGMRRPWCHWEAVCPYRAWGSIGVTMRQSVPTGREEASVSLDGSLSLRVVLKGCIILLSPPRFFFKKTGKNGFFKFCVFHPA